MLYIGTNAGDAGECRVVEEFFCKNREEPLLIGSVKSNMGHGEICAGLCSILKAIAIFRKEAIPANLNCEKIDKDIPGICNGKLQVSLDVLQTIQY